MLEYWNFESESENLWRVSNQSPKYFFTTKKLIGKRCKDLSTCNNIYFFVTLLLFSDCLHLHFFSFLLFCLHIFILHHFVVQISINNINKLQLSQLIGQHPSSQFIEQPLYPNTHQQYAQPYQ